MRIIYEDGADRPQKDISSGAVPAPPDTAATPEAALPNLTPEQITALLQILAAQQQTAQQSATQQPVPQKSETPKQQPAPPQDLGTRIIYQSEDFEQPEKTARKKPRRPVPDTGMRIAYQAKNPEAEREERNRKRAAQQGSFSVNEFSLVEDQPEDEPPARGDLAVREVDEATEAFQTQRAKKVSFRESKAQEPETALVQKTAPQESAAEPPVETPQPEPELPANEPELPVQMQEPPRPVPPAQPPRTPIAAVAVGESADDAALQEAALEREARLEEARAQEESAREAEKRAEQARLVEAEEERQRLERERAAEAQAAKEQKEREKEAERQEKIAAKAQKAQDKQDAKAQKAQGKQDARAQKAQDKLNAKAQKAQDKQDAKAQKAQAKAERKQRPRAKWSPTRKAVLAISLIAILASSGVLAWEYKLHKDNLKLESEISDLILETQIASPMIGGNTIVLTEEQQWAQLRGEFPGVTFPEGLQLKYARLYATNSDFVGYMEIPDVNLSLPVVQTNNDADYLNKNFFGASTKYGCPFVSCINNIAELDFNTVIYGHHMNDRTIFGALDAYKTVDGFRSAPVITFNTMYADYSWKIVAVFLTNAVPADDNGYVFNYYFNQLSSDEKKTEYFAALKERSLYDTGVDLLPTDKLLTLSTCSHVFDDARLVVVARMVRPGESADVDTSLATLNGSPRYPQVYYSKKKQTNPYADAPRWEVG